MSYFKDVLVRSYPVCVNGELINYRNDFESSSFTMEWNEGAKNDAPTIVYVCQLSKIKNENLVEFEIEKIKDSDAGYVIIPSNQKGGKRELTLLFEQ